MAMLEIDDVVLVSNDKAFYEGRDQAKGLSLTLSQECAGSPRTLTLLPGIPELLRAIREEVAIDPDALTAAFFKTELSVTSLLGRNGFAIKERSGLTAELFVTERANMLFLTFEMAFCCEDVSGCGREDATLMLAGDGFYDSGSQAFSQLGELGASLRFKDAEETEQERRNVTARMAGLVLGHRDIAYTVRHKLE